MCSQGVVWAELAGEGKVRTKLGLAVLLQTAEMSDETIAGMSAGAATIVTAEETETVIAVGTEALVKRTGTGVVIEAVTGVTAIETIIVIASRVGRPKWGMGTSEAHIGARVYQTV